MEIVTLLFILSLISLMIWDCTRLGIVDDFDPVSVSEFMNHVRTCRKFIDGKMKYDLSLPNNTTAYGKRVDNKHTVNQFMYIRTWIDFRGDLIEVFFKDKLILSYVDQRAQYGILMGIGDCTADSLFYSRRVQQLLRDVILVGEITNGINSFKEKQSNGF